MNNRDELKTLLEDGIITESEYDELSSRVSNKKSKRKKLKLSSIVVFLIFAIALNVFFSIVRRLWKIYKFYNDLPDILKVIR